MRAVREEMTEFADLDRGYVAVGVQAPSGLVSWMPKLLAAFTARYSHVQLTLFERTNRQLVTSMRDGDIHVAWLLVPDVGEVDTEGLTLHRLFSRELVFVVPSNHRLAHQDTVTLDELAGEPLILPRIGEPTRTILDGVFRTQGVQPNIRCEVTDPITLVQLASEGLGVAVSSAALARRSGTDVHTLRLEGHHMTYSFCLAWTERGSRTKAVAAFVDFAREWQTESMSEVIGPWEPNTGVAQIAGPKLIRAS
jgi:DNA-binding transcriptional LysR family regulator